jgi:hypothetical protein
MEISNAKAFIELVASEALRRGDCWRTPIWPDLKQGHGLRDQRRPPDEAIVKEFINGFELLTHFLVLAGLGDSHIGHILASRAPIPA